MQRLILLFCAILTTFLYSEEEERKPLNVEEGVSAIICGCVNAISGDFMQSANDLVVIGPEPLVFERFYTSSDYDTRSLYSGWRHNHDSYIVARGIPGIDNIQYLLADYVEPSGRSATYHGSKDNLFNAKMCCSCNKSLTNCGMGLISGKTNPKNTLISYDSKSHDIRVRNGFGSKVTFETGPTGGRVYALKEECKPNKHLLKYEYRDKENDVFSQVTAKDASDSITYGWIKIVDKKDKEFKKNPGFEVHASDGRKVIYKLKKFSCAQRDKEKGLKGHYYISEVNRTDAPKVRYSYARKPGSHRARIIAKILPKGRVQKVVYHDDKDDLFLIDRVRELRAPVGTDETPLITHRFKYSATIVDEKPLKYNEGSTEVYDALNYKTVYGYSAEHQLTEIKRFTGSEPYQLYSFEKYSWGQPKSRDAANLISKFLHDGNGTALCGRVFQYDLHGNVIQESCYGNITGSSNPLICTDSIPENTGADCYSKYYAYSQDGMNLMVKQTEDNGKGELYTYCPGTDLVASKMLIEVHSKKMQICQRQFFQYDTNGVLVKQITDDGNTSEESNLTNVSERRITYTHPKKTAPIGVPEQVDEMYLDRSTGSEILLRRTRNTYSIEGRLLKQDHFDSTGAFRYSLTWEYDSHGNVILEKDALGQCFVKRYDENDNLIFDQGPSGFQKQYAYDFANRLIRCEETDQYGTTLVTTHAYDLVSNRISSIDTCGNETKYTYDAFGRVTTIEYPATPNEAGNLIQTTVKKEYDVFGNVTVLTDQCGQTTTTHYNILNKPIEIHYPDGSHESFAYNTDGTLRKSIAKNGLVTLYEYDCFGRLLKKESVGTDGQFQDCIASVYNAFHLVASIDAEGRTTHHQYDGAGRLVLTTKEERKTTYEYDACGRLHKTREWYGDAPDAFRLTIKNYDQLNRLIEEHIEDGRQAELLRFSAYGYDADGNIVYETHGGSTTCREYNGWKQPIRTIDPQGNITRVLYEFNVPNPFNQKVLQIINIDALGIQTIQTMNALNQIGNITKKNAMGKVISQKELYYSGIGDCQYAIEKAIAPNAIERTVKTRWQYDSLHQLHDLIEAEGTAEQKHTSITYNRCGQKDTILKPDGSKIFHTYDGKGRLKTYQGTGFSYAYSYDLNDNMTSVVDPYNNTTTIRKYDSNNNMILEQLGSGQVLQYDYDKLGRPTLVQFSDGSIVKYCYDASNLKEIERIDASGTVLYRHLYTDYDLQGLVTGMQLIGNAGECSYEYDLLGQITHIGTATWSETLSYDVVGNLIKMESSESDISTFSYDDLYQLQCEKGVSTHTYEYDSLYNCVKKDGVENQINSLNQLLLQGDTSYTYDSNGNRSSQHSHGQTTEFTYDGLDRLTSVLKDNWQATYTYDALNRRLNKCIRERSGDTWNTIEKTTYLYHGQNEVGACDATGKISELRVLGVGKGAEIGATIAVEIRDAIYAPIHDSRGNIVSLLDPDSGQCVESYRYSAFGEEQIFDGSDNPLLSSVLGNSWRFSSKRVDIETGFIYFGRRYYDPVTTRWISPDPIGFDDGPNLYGFVMNSPLTHIDLYGLEWVQQGSKWVYQTTWKMQWNSFHPSRWAAERRNSPLRLPGRLISAIGKHLLPIPIVRDVIITCGHFLEGRGLVLHAMHRETHSYNKTIGKQELCPNERHIAIGGVLNDSDEFEETVRGMSNDLGGEKFHATYNASHGFCSDILECAAQELGIETNSVNKLVENLRARIKEVAPNGRVYVHAHSQGGLITYRAVQELEAEERRLLHVFTYGSAKIIDARSLGISGSRNYISVFDPIPFIGDPVGFIRSVYSNYGNAKFLKPRNLPLLDHVFSGEAYQKEFKTVARDFRRKYRDHYQ